MTSRSPPHLKEVLGYQPQRNPVLISDALPQFRVRCALELLPMRDRGLRDSKRVGDVRLRLLQLVAGFA